MDADKILDRLAETYGVTVEKLYPILYKQAIVEGVLSLIWVTTFTLLIIIFIFSMLYITKKQKETHKRDEARKIEIEKNGGYYFSSRNDEWDWEQPRQFIILLVGVVVTLVGFFAITMGIENAIVALYNTEYYMFNDILSKVKIGG